MKKVVFILCLLIFLQANTALALYGYNPNTKVLSLHFENYHGLGNRLKKIISYVRYYRPSQINLYWTDTGWVSAKFLDLFKFNYVPVVKEFNNKRLINDRTLLANPLFKYVRGWGLLVAKNDFKTTEPFSIDRMYNKIPQELIDIYVPYFTALEPSDLVKERIKSVYLPSNCVTVQVRNAPDYEEWFGGNEKLETFFKIMDSYPNDTMFFISAMSKEVANVFYRRYPERITELPNKNYKSMIDATADMFILGSTDETLCSYMSTFCEVAWWLNGAKSKVTVVGDGKFIKRKIDKLEIMDFIP